MSYSLIPHRTRDITPDDFESGRTLSERSRISGIREIDLWNEHIPLLPEDITGVFDPVRIPTMRVSFYRAVNAAYNACLHDDHGIIQDVSFTFDMEKKALVCSSLQLQQKGQGHGTKILKSMVELGAALGLKDFEFGAGLSHGGYIWAARGFEIDADYYKGKPVFRDYLGQAIRSRLLTIKDSLPSELYTECKVLSYLSNPDDITRLARQNRILDLKMDDFDLGNIYRHSALAAAFSQINAPDADRGMTAELNKIRSLIFEAADQGRDITLGQFLLYGSEWRAKLDFANDRQVQKLEAHMGAFRTLAQDEPEPQYVTGSGSRRVWGFAR